MRIAVLACSNGLGHVRRVIAISTFMLRNGFEGNIDAFLPLSNLRLLKKWVDGIYFLNHPNVKAFEFYYPKLNSENVNSESLNNKNWNDITLPSLDTYDVVWSDNILQVLSKRPDAILTGSFFWHEVFEARKYTDGLKRFIEDQKEILATYKPRMVGNEYFATDSVRNQTDYSPVGLYKYSINFKEKKRKGILISCGLGGEEEKITRYAVEQILAENLMPPEILYVEARLLPEQYPEWMVKADFSDDMFHECLAVCIRPGLGTVCDALVNHSKIFAFSNEDSFEMIHNCNVLEKLGVGLRCYNPYDAYQKALKFVNNKNEQNLQILRTSHLRKDGVFATSNFILGKHING